MSFRRDDAAGACCIIMGFIMYPCCGLGRTQLNPTLWDPERSKGKLLPEGKPGRYDILSLKWVVAAQEASSTNWTPPYSITAESRGSLKVQDTTST